MTDLIVAQNNLPATLEDLSRFVLIERDKLQAVRAEIFTLQKLKVAEEVLTQKRAEQSEIGIVVLLAEMKCSESLNQISKVNGGDRRSEEFKIRPASKFENENPEIETPKPKLEVAKELGFSKD